MIRHVVLWKVKGPSAERHAQCERIRQALHTLPGQIPGLRALEVGIGQPGEVEQSDVVLITTHDDWAALEVYQKHPEHQAVAKIIGELRVERRVVDFEV